ncbi:hypothetical protein AUK40_02510 [Candidatus Wirthbacteria bacterium CG2_30_54_11]|uniref:O-antigen polymerase n=1 Tax=Candidatus Wirthbacteria bacterium CG2_30_54_11 TaxID=1817892 RepID=A0A1J5IM50_9BACT|nr:MAG: hypothetical protein AUK40_02510 [Candidatus Wirthbacteria bacterium CG2_30_54_11]
MKETVPNLLHYIRSVPWHRRLFYLLVLVLPLGGRLRFAREASMLYGQIGEYIIPELYLTDIILVLVLTTWLYSLIRKRSVQSVSVTAQWFLFFFIVMLIGGAASISSAVMPWAGYYRLLKLCEWGCLVWYITAGSWQKRDFVFLAVCLAAGGVGQSLLSWYQFTAQASLASGFAAHAIGEQPLSIWQNGISYVWALGQKLMRPYGTFSHPNALSSYLLVSLIAGVALWIDRQTPPPSPSEDERLRRTSPAPSLSKEGIKSIGFRRSQRIWLTGALVVIAGGVGIALSRVVWFLAAASIGLVAILYPLEISRFVREHLFRSLRASDPARKLVTAAAAVSALSLVAGGVYLMFIRIGTLWSSNQITVTGRILLNSFALRMMELHPLGIGLGNFTAVVRDFDATGYFNNVIQPVHNVFLLVGSEMGVVSLISFFIMIGLVVHAVITGLARSNDGTGTIIGLALFAMLSSCLAILFVDHYLWTIQQGQLIWWMVCAFCLRFASADRERSSLP